MRPSTEMGLFVYGTLRSDGPEGGLLGALGRTVATARGSLWRMPAGVPALTLDDGGVVHGELVHEPTEAMLRVLDLCKGVEDGLHRRVPLWAIVGLRRHRAWAYTMDDPHLRGGRPLPGGRWRARRGVQELDR